MLTTIIILLTVIIGVVGVFTALWTILKNNKVN